MPHEFSPEQRALLKHSGRANRVEISIGSRIPHEWFLTSGVGESDITVHAGSYHLALRDAGIEAANLIGYSSILPGDAVRMQRDPDRRPIVHGSVMEHIGAVATCEYGESATAGLIFGWLYDDDGNRYGGLVCEYSGGLVEERVEGHLREMLNELHTNGYEHFALRDIEVHTRSVTPTKMYGTALVAICFQSYLIPVHVPRGTRSGMFLTVGER